MTPGNRHVIRRFLLKTGLLAFFGLAQWRHGLAAAFSVLFGTAGMIDIAIASIRRIPFRRDQLSYWDEAVIFSLLSCLAAVSAGS